MKKTVVGGGLILAVTLVMSTTLLAQGSQGLPVPGIDAAKDIAGAKEVPDAKTEYKVLFDVGKAAATPSEVNPMLQAAARYVNTLAHVGVPPGHRKLAVIFHQGGTNAILKNDEYKKRNDGKDNPNIPLMQALAKAGVEFHVCGQAVLAAKINQQDIQPEIQVDLWALTTIINMELRGYVRIGG